MIMLGDAEDRVFRRLRSGPVDQGYSSPNQKMEPVITASPPGRSAVSGQVRSHRHGPLLRPCEIANHGRNHLNFGITGALMRGGGGAATLAALPTLRDTADRHISRCRRTSASRKLRK